MRKRLFLIVPVVTLIASSPVLAQSLPNLSLVDRQRLTRDLIPTNSQDFFRQGQAQLEREIRLLERRSQQENLLKIDPATRYPEEKNPRSWSQHQEKQRISYSHPL
ncbi:MAG: hypothetical protein KME10_09105 [Plectolyngbya sp. WJT66-NPBG17]|jgi:hypothetical protein|nr:hypothetical protein [Plectolyngbya sp. WJT66-NPBG17]